MAYGITIASISTPTGWSGDTELFQNSSKINGLLVVNGQYLRYYSRQKGQR